MDDTLSEQHMENIYVLVLLDQRRLLQRLPVMQLGDGTAERHTQSLCFGGTQHPVRRGVYLGLSVAISTVPDNASGAWF